MALRNELGIILTIVLTLGGVASASAQSLEEEQAAAEGSGELGSPSGEAEVELSVGLEDEQADAEGASSGEDEEAEPVVDSSSPLELPNTDYFFLGAFARGIIIPGFIQQLFVDGGIDGFNPGAGLTFNWRRNNFNVIANVWWNGASADGYFRALGDPRTDTEYIDVDLGVLFLNAAFLWSFPVDEQNIFAIELGFDLGVGFVYGDLRRTEAYETPGADDWQPCETTTPGGQVPANSHGGYCEPPAPDPCYSSNGGHYNCREPNWTTEGGDTPVVVGWLAVPHLAIRIKPVRQFQIRIDGGYGLYNFFFGGSLSYGF